MSKIIVNQIESSDGTTDILNTLSAVSLGGGGGIAGAGKVLQQQFINASDYGHVSMTSTGMTNIGLSANFTPLAATSKIHITFSVSTWLASQYGGGFRFDRWIGSTPTNLFNGLNNSGDNYYDAYITESGGNTTFIYRWQHMVEDDLSGWSSGSIFYEVSASATSSSYDFHVNLTRDGTGGTGTLQKNTGNWMLIQEIAG